VTTLVFDNTLLSHAARAARLDFVRLLAQGRRCILPEEVADEFLRGVAEHPALGQIQGAPWLELVKTGEKELRDFASFKGRLGGGPKRNNGEAAALAWAKVNGGTVIIDDGAGRTAGADAGLPMMYTLELVIDAIKSGIIDDSAAEEFVDDLLGTEMRLPVDSGLEFITWAHRVGRLP
jgi:predicted nucleic acid-binding protein